MLRTRNEPTDQDVREALDRVLASSPFVRARRARGFLRFVTEQTLAGRADSVSGYTIAVEVFRRPVDFDAANDPLVRVEAGRVRLRLCEYYATEGRNDPIRIELRLGNYVPTFTYVDPPGAEQPSPPLRRFLAPLVALPALALLAVVWALGSNAPPAASLDGNASEATRVVPTVAAERNAARVAVHPFQNLGADESRPLALGVTEEVMTRLGRYAGVRVVVATDDTLPAVSGTARNRAPAAADYELLGSIRASPEKIRVLPRLVDARTGQQVWTAIYEEARGVDNVWKIIDEVAKAVAGTVGAPYGPLFDAEVARSLESPVETVDAYHCLLRFVFALEVISEGAHGRATDCFERAVAEEPGSSTSWARLAALYRMEYLHDFNVKDGATPALERAETAVRRALALDPGNAFAHQEQAFLCLLHDDRAGFEQSVARALALDPSADLRTAIGINFVKMGEAERGFALMEQGVAESPRAPPFFFLGYVVHALRLHDHEAAYRWAERAATPDWPLSQAVLAAVAALAGHNDRAREAAWRLLELRPEFATTGREQLARGRLGAEAEGALVAGLALAGVTLR